MSETELQDPGDTEAYLRLNSWTKIKEFDEIERREGSTYYSRTFEVDGTSVDVILELTAGNRRKFHFEDPPKVVREAAHDGDCLTSRGIADGDTLYRLHFKKSPDSIADGVRVIRRMLRGES